MVPSVYPEKNAPEQPDVVPAARRAYSGAMLNLLVYALVGEALAILTISIWKITNPGQQPSMTASYLLQFIPVYGLAFPLYLLIARTQKADPPEKHKLSAGQLICAFLMSIGISVVGAIIGVIVISILMALFGVDTGTTFLQEGVVSDGALVLTVIASFFAPVVEEMLFRKILIDRIRKYGNVAAILLSGLLFGLFHGNFTQFFFASMLGFFFAFIYIRTGNILYTILLHFGINFLSSGIAGTLLRRADFDAEELMTAILRLEVDKLLPYLPLGIYMLVYYGAALTGFILLIIFRKQFRVGPSELQLPKKKRFPAACLNLGCVLFVLFCISQFVIRTVQNGA
ncbi:MAG: CPBP family intramembrane metalloprotease [Oscillospiraceae bacterium]|nr:CPBP family intramembrane metalloprotease [Oscillospiraceae bacterium]